MKISEFKAWMEGFNEAVNVKPTKEQYQKILDKLETVEESVEVKWYPYHTNNTWQPYQPYFYGTGRIDATPTITCSNYSGTATTDTGTDTSMAYYEQGKQDALN